jgi:hypothetical protein
MTNPKSIDVDLIKRLVEHDEESGNLIWKVRSVEFFKNDRVMKAWNTRWAGKIAKSDISRGGYVRVKILDKFYLAHRLIWALHTGKDFSEDIDHINGNRKDNKISNLRAVNRAENTRNRCLSKSNTSGVMGVYFDKREKKWQAQTVFKGNLCRQAFKNFDEAVLARSAQVDEVGFSKRHGCSSEH